MHYISRVIGQLEHLGPKPKRSACESIEVCVVPLIIAEEFLVKVWPRPRARQQPTAAEKTATVSGHYTLTVRRLGGQPSGSKNGMQEVSGADSSAASNATPTSPLYRLSGGIFRAV
jgi:hypothetical protein